MDESSDNKPLMNPVKKFTYVTPKNLDDTYAVLTTSETARWSHTGIFGYRRNTTPRLAQGENPATSRGYSCDTTTELSLRCTFVREDGAKENPQYILKEQNIFSVLSQLGFKIGLYAM